MNKVWISPALAAAALFPAITALNEKFTVELGGMLRGGLKVNTVVLVGGVTVTDGSPSGTVAVSVNELSNDGLLTVTVTLLSNSKVSPELV